VLVQLGGLAYAPADVLPAAAHRRAGDALIDLLRRFDGPVLMLGSSYYPVMAGKPSHAHLMALQDVARARGQEALREKLIGELNAALVARRFGAVILDRPGPPQGIEDGGYVYAGPVLDDADALRPPAGKGYRPEALYVPGAPPAP
jgi:hypothetical protein